MSRRWSVDGLGINIMASKPFNPNDLNSTNRLFEVLDIYSLDSAYLVLIDSIGSAARYKETAPARQDNLYLLSEFIPTDESQKSLARTFYEESDALVTKTMGYPVIKDMNRAGSGDWTIEAVGE